MYRVAASVSHLPLLISIFLITIASGENKFRFDNYRVYSFRLNNENELKTIQAIEDNVNGLIFLNEPGLNRKTALLVPPYGFEEVHTIFESLKLDFKIETWNFQKIIDAEQRSGNEKGYNWTRYHNLGEIYDWLDEMLGNYPEVLSNVTVGTSYQNRTIRAVKLSYKPGNPTIFIESVIHAREWIAVATSTYLLNELLTSSDPSMVDLAKNFDWVFVPVLNVDGYAYTHEYNRLWRKTRKPHSTLCYGVDLNRNFGVHFGSIGTSKNPCSYLYSGPEKFSEPETKALVSFVEKFHNIKLYLALHSYGQYILHPPAYNSIPTWNERDLMQISLKARDAIKTRFGTDYISFSLGSLYLHSGTSNDWAFSDRNISLAYTFELRDRRDGKYGFVLPPEQIIPNCLEFIDGLKAMIKEAKALNYF